MPVRALVGVLLLSAGLLAQWYTAPAGSRPALRRAESSVLPGGRVVAPLGEQFATGAGPFGLAVSASGDTVLTSNLGPGRNSVTILERNPSGNWTGRHIVASARADSQEGGSPEWLGVSTGIVIAREHTAFVSEGNSGRVTFLEWNGDRRRSIDLDQGGTSDSYTGDLAFDAQRAVLYVLDQANFRICSIDTRSRRLLAGLPVGRLPFALALSPDGRKAFVVNAGTFQYTPLPGAATAEGVLGFPPFGFPGSEALAGVERQGTRGTVRVPGLGDPASPQANSLAIVDISDPAAPKLEAWVPTGASWKPGVWGGASPSGVLATQNRVYVSNAGNDSISVIDARTNRVETEIPLRIPGLENLRGVIPGGMAIHEPAGWLLVAEAGLNAVGVIDIRQNRLIGHLPAGWYPTRVAVANGTVFVANSRGRGAGPDAIGRLPDHLWDGSVSIFPVPEPADLAALTARVLESAGLAPAGPARTPAAVPEGIRHVVVIAKAGRSYDEVFGDLRRTSSGLAMGDPRMARFGTYGYVDGRGQRFSLQEVNVTPNHHAIARRWAFSDNFYADSETGMGGHRWLAGVYPNLWTATTLAAAAGEQRKDFRLGTAPGRLLFPTSAASVTPEDRSEGGTIWDHLARHNVSFYNFGEGLDLPGSRPGLFPTNLPLPEPLYNATSREYPGPDMAISDQQRATLFIAQIESRYGKAGVELPQFIFVNLPGDRMADPRPEAGYPYRESYVVDNDYALGRILEYLSSKPWWNRMAVFVTEDSAGGGVDHIDAHRTLLLVAGPWSKRNYVSHVNASFPALLKTVFRLLRVPPLNLFDASAADLSDCFTARPDNAPYRAQPVDKRIFDPDFVPQAGSGEASRGAGDPPERGRPPRR